MLRVPSVDKVYGTRWRAATRATAVSPADVAMRVNPVGENAKGNGRRDPITVTLVSICETSTNTRGVRCTRSNAAELLAIDHSVSAAPSK